MALLPKTAVTDGASEGAWDLDRRMQRCFMVHAMQEEDMRGIS